MTFITSFIHLLPFPPTDIPLLPALQLIRPGRETKHICSVGSRSWNVPHLFNKVSNDTDKRFRGYILLSERGWHDY